MRPGTAAASSRLILSIVLALVLALVRSFTSPTPTPILTPTMSAATLREEDVTIPPSSDGGVRLAAKVFNRRSPVAVILTHPYGPLGGNMYNNVIVKLTQSLAREGFTTVRFNARGVAPSTGRTSWRGLKEKADLEAVCQYVLTQLEEPPARLVLIGYSHGSVVASAVAGEMPEVLAYAAIAYPFSVAWALTLFHQGRFLAAASQGGKPKLFLMGTEDNFTGIGAFRAKVKALPSPLEVVEIKGADHFFFGIEHKVWEPIHGWLKRVLGTVDLKALMSQPTSTPIGVVDELADAHHEL